MESTRPRPSSYWLSRALAAPSPLAIPFQSLAGSRRPDYSIPFSSYYEHPNGGKASADDGLSEQRAKQPESEEEDGSMKHGRHHHHPKIILDSGGTHHVTSDRALLFGFTTAAAEEGSSGAAAYHARDGRTLPVAGAGTVSCQDFRIPSVRYVPGLGAGVTLVSVQQLAECDYLVMFGGGRCYVKDRSGSGKGKVVGKGHLHDDDGLYHLELLTVAPTGAASDVTESTVA